MSGDEKVAAVAYLRMLADKYASFASTAEGAMTRGTFRTLATLMAEEANVLESELPTCTCPSGDGSLRWPCPVHPPIGSEGRES